MLIRGVVSSPIRGVVGSPVLSGGNGAYLDFDFRYPTQGYWVNGTPYAQFTDIPGATSTGGAGFGTAQRNDVWQSIPANAPLIGDGGLGVYEARTNSAGSPLALNNQTVWATVSGAGAAPYGGSSPGGDSPAWIVTGGGIATSRIQAIVSALLDTPQSLSIWFRQGSAPTFHVAVFDAPVTTRLAQASITFSGGEPTISNTVGSFITAPYITPDDDGWWLLRYTVSSGAFSSLRMMLYPDANFGTGSTVFWAPNIKPGPDINDPPILQTTGLPATRTAVAQSVGGLVLPSGDFDIEQEFKIGPLGAQRRPFEYHNGTDDERLIVIQNSSGGLFASVVISGVSTQIGSTAAPLPAGANTLASLQRRGGNWRFAVNEAQVGGDLSAGVPAVNAVTFGHRRNVTEFLNSTISRHIVRPA